MSKADDPRDEELSALYRSAAGESPSAGLDARILAAARAAAAPPREAAPPRGTASWTRRWRVPLALAATVLMTSTLTLLVREHDVDGAGSVLPKPVPAERGPGLAAPGAAAGPRREDHSEDSTAARDRLADRPREERRNLLQPEPAPRRAVPLPTESAAGPAAAASALRPAQPGTAEHSPEQWLEEIRQLRREGKSAEADARLADFRRRFPRFPLPEDMRQP